MEKKWLDKSAKTGAFLPSQLEELSFLGDIADFFFKTALKLKKKMDNPQGKGRWNFSLTGCQHCYQTLFKASTQKWQ